MYVAADCCGYHRNLGVCANFLHCQALTRLLNTLKGSSSLALARKHIIAAVAGGRWMPEKDHARIVLFFSWMNKVVGLSFGTE